MTNTFTNSPLDALWSDGIAVVRSYFAGLDDLSELTLPVGTAVKISYGNAHSTVGLVVNNAYLSDANAWVIHNGFTTDRNNSTVRTGECHQMIPTSDISQIDVVEPDNRVLTKHGGKARKVTREQEAALDAIDSDVFTDPIVKVNVLNEDFNNVVAVYTTDGVNRTLTAFIAENGTVAPL